VLRREIQAIRKRGYAESKGGIFTGGGALTAPLKDFSGKTVAVMDILTPEHRYTPQHRERCIALLLDGARRGSDRLGFRPGAGRPAPPRRPAGPEPAGGRPRGRSPAGRTGASPR